MQRKYLAPCYENYLESEKFSVKWKWNQAAKWKMKTYYNNYNYSILTFEVILTCTDVSQKCIEQNKSINCDLNCCFGTPLMPIVCISDKMLHCTWGPQLCVTALLRLPTTLALYHTVACSSFRFFYLFRTHPCHHNLNPPKTRGSQYSWNFFRARAFLSSWKAIPSKIYGRDSCTHHARREKLVSIRRC